MNKGATARGEPAQDTSTADSAAAELYAGDPEQFTERRKDLAAAARAAGDREGARQIAALRKPTRAAWVVNRLARTVPDAPGKLAGLASALRDAEQSRDGRRLRAESARRGALIDDLTDQAFAAAGIPDPPPGLREEVTGTLAAALADPGVAAQFASGTMTRAATWSGFGFGAGLAESDDAEPGAASPAGAESAAGSGATPVVPVPLPAQAPRRLPPQRSRHTPAESGPSPAVEPGREDATTPRGTPKAPLTPASQTASRRPPTASGRTSSRATAGPPQPSIEDAERTLATAAAIAAQSAAAEERLEIHVRDLEQQLTQARADLADARLKARHAEAAERKARQALARRQAASP